MKLPQWWIDWRRGYTDADITKLEAKLSDAYPQSLEPGSYIALTPGEMNAFLAGGEPIKMTPPVLKERNKLL